MNDIIMPRGIELKQRDGLGVVLTASVVAWERKKSMCKKGRGSTKELQTSERMGRFKGDGCACGEKMTGRVGWKVVLRKQLREWQTRLLFYLEHEGGKTDRKKKDGSQTGLHKKKQTGRRRASKALGPTRLWKNQGEDRQVQKEGLRLHRKRENEILKPRRGEEKEKV